MVKTSIERIRRRDLVEAAFQTFLDGGMSGTTVARIGQRAGMSHGIVNYYFKSKDELLSAVIRYAFQLILRECILLLRQANSPRERISAVIRANFPERLFNRETAAAWATFYGEIPNNAEFGRLQGVFYRRLRSNLIYHLQQLAIAPDAERIALGISVWIDGLWLRSAMKEHWMDREEAVRVIEEYVDMSLAHSVRRSRAATRGIAARKRPARRARQRS